MFGYIDPDDKDKYVRLGEVSGLIKRLDDLLYQYNMDTSESEMNLVFFEDCISHLTRISRILRQPRGNALLVGVGGSGRHSMARLASFINSAGGDPNASMKTFQIEITKNYKEKDFQDSIKDLLRKCALEDDQQQFLFSDSQIVSDAFLEDINNLLNTGEIPNLFPKDEKDVICDEVSDKYKDKPNLDNREQ